MDQPFWCALIYHFGQRVTVLWFHLVQHVSGFGNKSQHDHSIPSASEWNGGEIPQILKKCPQGTLQWIKLVRALALGTFGPEDSA
jgi:hypothetical protein